MTATGIVAEHIPEGPERDELLGLVRMGLAFRAQQCGRHPGFLAQYVRGIVAGLDHPTFAALLIELELCAVRRNLRGAAASPIEKVDRAWELVTYHDPRHGRRQVTLKTIRNLVPLRAIPSAAKSGTRLRNVVSQPAHSGPGQSTAEREQWLT